MYLAAPTTSYSRAFVLQRPQITGSWNRKPEQSQKGTTLPRGSKYSIFKDPGPTILICACAARLLALMDTAAIAETTATPAHTDKDATTNRSL